MPDAAASFVGCTSTPAAGCGASDVAGGEPEDVLTDLVNFFLPLPEVETVLADLAFVEGPAGHAELHVW